MFFDNISKSESRILEIFFSNPFKKFTLKELQNKNDVSYMTIFRNVTKFEEMDIVKKIEESDQKFRVLNFENDIVLKLLELFEVNRRLELINDNPKFWSFLKEIKEKSIRGLGRNLLMLIVPKSIPKSGPMIFFVVDRPKEKYERIIESTFSNLTFENNYITKVVITLGEFIGDIKNRMDRFQEIRSKLIILYGEAVFWNEILN